MILKGLFLSSRNVFAPRIDSYPGSLTYRVCGYLGGFQPLFYDRVEPRGYSGEISQGEE